MASFLFGRVQYRHLSQWENWHRCIQPLADSIIGSVFWLRGHIGNSSVTLQVGGPITLHRGMELIYKGWITVSGWVAAVAGGSFFVATLIQALITTDHTAYSPTGWQATLLLWAVVLISLLLNTVFNRVLPVLEIFILLFHVLVFFAIIIPLVYLSPHNSSKYVFTTFNNAGGFSTVALASFVGMTGNALAFVGKFCSQSC